MSVWNIESGVAVRSQLLFGLNGSPIHRAHLSGDGSRLVTLTRGAMLEAGLENPYWFSAAKYQNIGFRRFVLVR